MSRADEIFEKLGYIKRELEDINNEIIFIIYEKKYIKNNKNISRNINFNILDKCLHIKNIQILELEELQAINEKVKELGWNE